MKKLTVLIAIASLASSSLYADEKEDVMALGQMKFQLCMACHGPDGLGIKPAPGLVMAPSLAESKIVKGNPKALAAAIMKGIKKEDAKFIGVMLPLESGMNDAELAAVMTFVRNTYGGQSGLITEGDAAKWRSLYADSKEALSRGELEKQAAEKNQ